MGSFLSWSISLGFFFPNKFLLLSGQKEVRYNYEDIDDGEKHTPNW